MMVMIGDFMFSTKQKGDRTEVRVSLMIAAGSKAVTLLDKEPTRDELKALGKKWIAENYGK